MRRVSVLILLAAVGVHSFGVNGKAIRQTTKSVTGPFPSTLPFPSPTSLQQMRWDRDYRDNSPASGPRGSRYYGNRNSLTGPPSIYNEAPQSTEAGWWNEEKKNYRTTQNRVDHRVYSSGKYNNGMGNTNYLPVANVNSERYDVTPEEWKTNSGGVNSGNNRYHNDNYENGRPRQILRANDRDGRPYEYNVGMPPLDYGNDQGRRSMDNNRFSDYNNNNMNNGYDNNNNYPPGPQYNNNMNDYNYGFGEQRGEVVGSYNNVNSDPNDVTPAEWQDSKRSRRQGGAMVPGAPGRGNFNNNGFNGGNSNNMYNNGNTNDNRNNMNVNGNINDNRNNMNGNGNFNNNNDNGLYDPMAGQGGSWWTQESKDYRTNVGRQETRNYGGGATSTDRNLNRVTPDEWNDSRGGYNNRQQDGRFGMQAVGYKENVQGPSRQVRSWWDNVRSGFRNGGAGYRPRYSNYYKNKEPWNRNSLNGRSNFVNVGYNNNNSNSNNGNGYSQRNNYVNNDYNNGYDQSPRYESYYDEYSRPEYVTQDSDWWKEENRKYW